MPISLVLQRAGHRGERPAGRCRWWPAQWPGGQCRAARGRPTLPCSGSTRWSGTGSPRAFAEPTAAQAGAWDAIGKGEHTLVVAPTGSGKTLAAFLSAIDDLVARAEPPADPRRSAARVLYLSPLKALAVGRRAEPALAAGRASARSRPGAGVALPEITVAVRSGDTPSGDRRAFARDGADILITTPESLFLLLTSRRPGDADRRPTVIIDEVHAVAGTKRGAHLAVSLDRLDALLGPARRSGSGCPPRSGRSRRSPGSWPAAGR